MPLKNLRPITPGTRNAVRPSFEEITTSKPEKSLLEPLQKRGGRNNRGQITAFHRGGGSRRMYRKVDFKRRKDGVPATVKSIEYDPNRTTRIALLHYVDGEKSYILAPVSLSVGDHVESGPAAEISPGNSLPLRNIPTGTVVHNLELTPGRGRSAGSRGWHWRAGAVARGRICAHPVAFRGDATDSAQLSRQRRTTVQPRPQKRKPGQGRSKTAPGKASPRPRRCQEPRGSPARRRGRTLTDRYAGPQVTHRQANVGAQDSQQEKDIQPVHYPGTSPTSLGRIITNIQACDCYVKVSKKRDPTSTRSC